MSRIQQILDKAEREGSVRRTLTAPLPAPQAAAPSSAPPLDGHRAAVTGGPWPYATPAGESAASRNAVAA